MIGLVAMIIVNNEFIFGELNYCRNDIFGAPLFVEVSSFVLITEVSGE